MSVFFSSPTFIIQAADQVTGQTPIHTSACTHTHTHTHTLHTLTFFISRSLSFLLSPAPSSDCFSPEALEKEKKKKNEKRTLSLTLAQNWLIVYVLEKASGAIGAIKKGGGDGVEVDEVFY